MSSGCYLLVLISVLDPKKRKRMKYYSISFGFLLILVLPLILASAQNGKYERAAYHDSYEGAAQDDQDQGQGPATYDKNDDKESEPEQNGQNYEQNGDDNAPSLDIPTLLDNLASDDLLSFGYYSKSCPKAESIINKYVTKWVEEDRTLAASLLRLHFHDCAVHGCDASILLNHEGSERTAEASKSLRGFEVIDDIKAEIEKECPRTVSCADILTAASRDATVLLGGPYWDVPYGRKDGKVSVEKDAELVPMGRENITTLIEFYQSNGLNVIDLVVLSGAHTIGRATCGSLQFRLYNYAGTGRQDESLDSRYANFLKRKCRWASEYVDLDATTPQTFDNVYYKNLQAKMGLLLTDQSLYSDPRTSPIVDALADAPSEFFNHQFAVSMTRLGNILVPAAQDGGAHTIGRATCGSLQFRLYNYAGTGRQDESLDSRYANFLKRKCRWASEYVDLDATTPQTFDNVYYKNLQAKMGLLLTDQSLYSDPRTSPIVDALADAPSEFFNHQFAVSMTRLGNILVPAAQDGGEIRTKCYSVNSNY